MNYSYDFQNLVRDLSNEIDEIRKSQPSFLSLVPIRGVANHTKHEWLEDVMQPQQDALNGAIADGTTTAFTVDDGTKFAVNDIWVNVDTDERFKVTAVSTNDLTVVRGVGGTAAAMADNAVLKLVARPQVQGTNPGDDEGQEPTTAYNYTQIFSRTAKVTRTGQNVRAYGIEDQLNYQVKVLLDQILREMNNTALFGVRQAPAANTPGMMSGVVTFLETVGTNKVNGAGGALTKDMLNDALELAFNDGAGELAILCGPNQARAITALDSNYQIIRTDTTSGKAIMEYKGDIAGSAAASKIVVDPNYSKKRVDFVDLSRLALVPLAGSAIRDMDATLPGADYVSRRILGEYTLEFKNAADAHASVYNLAA